MKIERDTSHSFQFVLSSGDEEYPGCTLTISIFGRRVRLNMPAIIKPDVLQVRGQYNYDDLIERRYGIYLFENHFNVMYGRGDANFHRDEFGQEQRWSCFLPWKEQRHVRHSLYDLFGEHLYSDYDSIKNPNRYDSFRLMKENAPKAVFKFKDFDGEENEANTQIEEREWRQGTGWFKWLSWFSKPMISRSLDIEFDKETGKRKGSWKGGTIGTSIAMEKDELHESAFKRYCRKHDMTFVDRVRRF